MVNYIFQFKIIATAEPNLSSCKSQIEEYNLLEYMCHWEITEMNIRLIELDIG
jgi:hypothetical protein